MSSRAKLAANRANAGRSTGPISARGKSLSRLNALKSGTFAAINLLPGEDAKAYESLSTQVHEHYQPSGPIEGFLVHQITRAMWRLMRLERAEYAALKQVEIEFARGQTRNEGMSVEDILMSQLESSKGARNAFVGVLAREENKQYADAGDKRKFGNLVADQISKFDDSDLPPTAYTFLEGYAGKRYGLIDRIDQQKRALMREYFATMQMLKSIQADRKTVTIPEVDAEERLPYAEQDRPSPESV